MKMTKAEWLAEQKRERASVLKQIAKDEQRARNQELLAGGEQRQQIIADYEQQKRADAMRIKHLAEQRCQYEWWLRDHGEPAKSNARQIEIADERP